MCIFVSAAQWQSLNKSMVQYSSTVTGYDFQIPAALQPVGGSRERKNMKTSSSMVGREEQPTVHVEHEFNHPMIDRDDD